MKLIVGLGNPGEEFEGTRHNVGFAVVDRLATELDTQFQRDNNFQALIARSDDKKIILSKPLTFMNLSGQAVQAVRSFYKIPDQNIWLVYDDVDLPIGSARVRGKGRGGTSHRGVQSVSLALGTTNFPRFRVGIARVKETGRVGEHPERPIDLKGFVLEPFDKREQPLLEKAIAWTVEEILKSLKNNTVSSHTLTKGV